MTPAVTTILAPPVSARQALWLQLALWFGLAFAPPAVVAPSSLLINFLMFLWYCRVRDAQGRRKSLGRNIAMLCAPMVAAPVFLMRHLPWRGKLRALLRFVGFVVLLMIASVAGGFLHALAWPAHAR